VVVVVVVLVVAAVVVVVVEAERHFDWQRLMMKEGVK
jgi:hypothetical protein